MGGDDCKCCKESKGCCCCCKCCGKTVEYKCDEHKCCNCCNTFVKVGGCCDNKKIKASKKGKCCDSKKAKAPKKGKCCDNKKVVKSDAPEITIAVGGKKVTIKIEDLN